MENNKTDITETHIGESVKNANKNTIFMLMSVLLQLASVIV